MLEEQFAQHCIKFEVYQTGYQGAIQAYTDQIHNYNLSGPTNYSEIIACINNKQVAHELFYKVCVIITDGDPQDMKETIDQIVISSFKPVSFIIFSVNHEVRSGTEHIGQDITAPPTFEQIKFLSKNLHFSHKFDCFQARKNIIYNKYCPLNTDFKEI